MKLEDKMKLYQTIRWARCKCGNLWYFDKKTSLECTTCHVDRPYPIDITSRTIVDSEGAQELAQETAEMIKEKHRSYDETLEIIKSLPMTWIPALLRELVIVGYQKKCFLPFGASRLINSVENSPDVGPGMFKSDWVDCRGCGNRIVQTAHDQKCNNCGVQL